MRPHAHRTRSPITPSRFLVVLTVAAGLALTLFLNAIDPAYPSRALHVGKDTASALVLILVAALLTGRLRRGRRLLDLLALAAVVVLAFENLLLGILTAVLEETSGPVTTWVSTTAGVLGAGLLAGAALAPERLLRDPGHALGLTAAGCVAVLALSVAITALGDLPPAFAEQPETAAELQRLSQAPGLLVAAVLTAALFLVAGVALARRSDTEADVFLLWLGAGAIVAAAAYANYALLPSAFTDFIYVGDLFHAAVAVVWGAGTIAVIGRYQEAYAGAAVLEERRRAARDAHDGVAQELALISTQVRTLPPEREATAQIRAAVERALDETRGAMSALARPVDEPFHVTLERTAEEVAVAFGAGIDVAIDPDASVPGPWREALPRIVREAIAAAARHGRARHVRVELLQAADGVRLRVADDGEAARPLPVSLMERAESLGGRCAVAPGPEGGLVVEVRLPDLRV